MDIPSDLRYSREHEWVRVEGNIGTIGITNFAQDQLGDIVFLNLPAVGTSVEQFGKLGEIESVKAVSDLYSPVGGEVTAVNQEAVNQPELVNKDPYGQGWLVKVRMSDTADVGRLLSANEYAQFTGQAGGQ